MLANEIIHTNMQYIYIGDIYYILEKYIIYWRYILYIGDYPDNAINCMSCLNMYYSDMSVHISYNNTWIWINTLDII